MKNNTTKELKAIIRSLKTAEEHEMTVLADSSYTVNDNANRLYQRLRYLCNKEGGVRVTREYNKISLVKTV